MASAYPVNESVRAFILAQWQAGDSAGLISINLDNGIGVPFRATMSRSAVMGVVVREETRLGMKLSHGTSEARALSLKEANRRAQTTRDSHRRSNPLTASRRKLARAMARAFAPPKLIAVPEAPPAPLPFVDLGSLKWHAADGCRWIAGDPRDGPDWCNAKAAYYGCPWCAYHLAKCYVRGSSVNRELRA